MQNECQHTQPDSFSAQPEKRSFFTKKKICASILIVLSLASIGWGLQESHKIYAQKSHIDNGGVFLTFFQTISEKQLTEDATFSGVESYKGRLLTTYDRSKPKTKKKCPT